MQSFNQNGLLRISNPKLSECVYRQLSRPRKDACRRKLPYGALVGASPDGRFRTIAVTHQHFLLLALLLALPVLARAEDIAPPPVPRFEPATCPKLPGADELAKASCGYLVVPENRSRPDGRDHSAHGREISCALSGEAA